MMHVQASCNDDEALFLSRLPHDIRGGSQPPSMPSPTRKHCTTATITLVLLAFATFLFLGYELGQIGYQRGNDDAVNLSCNTQIGRVSSNHQQQQQQQEMLALREEVDTLKKNFLKSEEESTDQHYPKHYPLLFGHVHIANGLFSNKFERVCGNKGYSYDSYQENERAKIEVPIMMGKGKQVHHRSKVGFGIMDEIGYENCDYISQERPASWWNKTFTNGTLVGIPIELHVPCRDPIDHLMSQCNHGRHKALSCDAKSDDDLFRAVDRCAVFLIRFKMTLKEQFTVKCYDFGMQFTNYTEYMSKFLQKRRFESLPYIKRETNTPRNKTAECIWERPELMEKVKKYLLKNFEYYQFCNGCLPSENNLLSDYHT